MSENSTSKQVPIPEGLIELTNPTDVSLAQLKSSIDFWVIGEILSKYEARNKEGFHQNV